ncbi:unnamed protein product [Linum tenue]|uniref:Snakin-2 n=1 Tax=Linum tenue TaxID=586396 RepID=A0AAV0HD34_9ROSI|nr:unnamed protein product [Linum tenue]
MATALINILVLLLPVCLVALQLAQCHNDILLIQDVADDPSSPPSIDCGEACKGRCRLSSRPNLCKRACGTCCERCHCVPPGTSGNYDTCPCYANMTTRGGKHKCP